MCIRDRVKGSVFYTYDNGDLTRTETYEEELTEIPANKTKRINTTYYEDGKITYSLSYKTGGETVDTRSEYNYKDTNIDQNSDTLDTVKEYKGDSKADKDLRRQTIYRAGKNKKN